MPRFHCHECRHEFNSHAAASSPACAACGGEFVEEVEDAADLNVFNHTERPSREGGRMFGHPDVFDLDVPELVGLGAASPSSSDSEDAWEVDTTQRAPQGPPSSSSSSDSEDDGDVQHPGPPSDSEDARPVPAASPNTRREVRTTTDASGTTTTTTTTTVMALGRDVSGVSSGDWTRLLGGPAPRARPAPRTNRFLSPLPDISGLTLPDDDYGIDAGGPALQIGDFALGSLTSIIDRLLTSAGSTPDAPASDQAVAALETITVTDKHVAEGLVCEIMLEPFAAGDHATRLPCGHCFGESAIRTWLATAHTCPVCRLELPRAGAGPSPTMAVPYLLDDRDRDGDRDDHDDLSDSEFADAERAAAHRATRAAYAPQLRLCEGAVRDFVLQTSLVSNAAVHIDQVCDGLEPQGFAPSMIRDSAARLEGLGLLVPAGPEAWTPPADAVSRHLAGEAPAPLPAPAAFSR